MVNPTQHISALPAATINQDNMSEKSHTEDHVESASGISNLKNGDAGFQYDRQMDRKVLLKLDLLVQPPMFIMFLFLLLDRTNVGNARVAGMQKDLHLTDNQYQICECSYH